MKKYILRIWHTKLARLVRNYIGFKPDYYRWGAFLRNHLASDLFVWRTDNNLVTIFRGSDILNKYYGLESYLKIFFYDCDGNYLNEVTSGFEDGFAEILMTKNSLGYEGIGTFCVLNMPKNATNEKLSVINRCYVGYGKGDNFSMVHGNIISVMTPSQKLETMNKRRLVSAVYDINRQTQYFIQKNFSSSARHSLMFVNPRDSDISVTANGKSVKIPSRGCRSVIPDIDDTGLVSIKSNFFSPRPLVMTESGQWIDVHHG